MHYVLLPCHWCPAKTYIRLLFSSDGVEGVRDLLLDNLRLLPVCLRLGGVYPSLDLRDANTIIVQVSRKNKRILYS